jgi:hypothetical protein
LEKWNACFTQNETLDEEVFRFFQNAPQNLGEKLCWVLCPPITLKKNDRVGLYGSVNQ